MLTVALLLSPDCIDKGALVEALSSGMQQQAESQHIAVHRKRHASLNEVERVNQENLSQIVDRMIAQGTKQMICCPRLVCLLFMVVLSSFSSDSFKHVFTFLTFRALSGDFASPGT